MAVAPAHILLRALCWSKRAAAFFEKPQDRAERAFLRQGLYGVLQLILEKRREAGVEGHRPASAAR
ncbi:MAG: hypothetical protein WAU17_08685, partial [Nitrospirales bacterium]